MISAFSQEHKKRLISEIIIKKNEIKVYIKALDPGTVPGFIINSKKEEQSGGFLKMRKNHKIKAALFAGLAGTMLFGSCMTAYAAGVTKAN